jgi:ElaB/YqjD/DUF883 family membrane-anchored ribosome-binding protein
MQKSEIEKLILLLEELISKWRLECQQVEVLIGQIPKDFRVLKATLNEMLKASGPAQDADYFALKVQIGVSLKEILTAEGNLQLLITRFRNGYKDGDQVANEVVNAGRNVQMLKALVDRIQKALSNLSGMIANFTQISSVFNTTITDFQNIFKDCIIPVNVQKRRSELQLFVQILA